MASAPSAAPVQAGPTPERIMQMTWAFAAPLALEAAVKNRVFDALDAGPKSLDELVAATGASARGLRAICDALVGLQFLGRDDDRYTLTAESSAFLVSTKPSFQGFLLKHVSKQLVPAWLELSETVRSGKPNRRANTEADGGAFFAEFVTDLFPMSIPATQAVASEIKVAQMSGPVHVLDVAAGSGVWGIGLAKQNKNVRVMAVDWASVTPVTRQVAAREGVADQLTTVDGDILEVPLQANTFDVATLGHIIHSEGTERSRRLLRRMFDALKPGGTVVIAEFTPDADRRGPVGPLLFAINMLVNTEEGDTFSFEEISAWLTEAGFEQPRQLPAPGPSPLILATKPR